MAYSIAPRTRQGQTDHINQPSPHVGEHKYGVQYSVASPLITCPRLGIGTIRNSKPHVTCSLGAKSLLPHIIHFVPSLPPRVLPYLPSRTAYGSRLPRLSPTDSHNTHQNDESQSQRARPTNRSRRRLHRAYRRSTRRVTTALHSRRTPVSQALDSINHHPRYPISHGPNSHTHVEHN